MYNIHMYINIHIYVTYSNDIILLHVYTCVILMFVVFHNTCALHRRVHSWVTTFPPYPSALLERYDDCSPECWLLATGYMS